jgi:hypothetical protein
MSPSSNDYPKSKIFKRRGMELFTPSGTSYPDPEDASLNRLPGRRYRSLFVLGLRLCRTNPLLAKQSYQNLMKDYIENYKRKEQGVTLTADACYDKPLKD